MKYAIALLAMFYLSSPVTAQQLHPLRSAEGTSVVSTNGPAAKIRVPDGAVYVGAVRFVLFEAADCEIHLFVDADASKRIRRVYWVQFEAYLPEQPTLRYEAGKSYSPVEMSGLPFYQRARFGQSSDIPRPGSDAEAAYALLKQNGYTLPPETVNVTYKHFFADMRKELLLMVIEDMSLSGVTFEQLVKDGALQPAWDPIAEQLKARSSNVFTIRTPSIASE